MDDESFERFLGRYSQCWSSCDETTLEKVFTPDAVYIEGGMHVEYSGLAEVLRFFRYMLKFSSDSKIEFEGFSRGSGEFVAEWVWSGTADGPLRLGEQIFDGNGQKYAVEGVALCRFAPDGRVSYHKDYYNVHDLVDQLGLTL